MSRCEKHHESYLLGNVNICRLRDVSFKAEAVNASYRTGARVGLNMS